MKTNLSIQRSVFLVIILVVSLKATSQVDQRIARADKYFDAGEYFTAAGLYEQFLNPPKKEIPKANFPLNTRRYGHGGETVVDKYDIIYKQAESYRLANYWQEAAARYKECFEKDFAKYTDAFYWYAVCQRSLGKYAATEEYLNRFLKATAANDSRKQDAERELQTIQFIKGQLIRPDSILFKIKKNATSFGKEKGLFALNPIGDDRFIFTSTVTGAASGKDNPNHSRLFYGTLNNGSLENIQQVIIQDADTSFNQGAASISADKTNLYFTQWRKENGKNISFIYFSTQGEKGWEKPVLIPAINKKGFNSKQPFCSADGKTIFFASDMPGGSGGFDIWYATIQSDGTISEPVNAGSINTKEDEQAPFYHSNSSTLVFSSNGRLGMGGFDLFTAKMKESVFENPENMGSPVNSSRDDIYFFVSEKNELLKNAIVGSDRGAECCLETYTVSKSPKKKIISGIVRDCKNTEPLADAIVTMKNNSGQDQQLTTGADGKFSFALVGDMSSHSFHITKENYKQRLALAATESVNESDLLIDVFMNVPICINEIEKPAEKKLEIKAENVVSVYFDFDKSLLKDRSMAILDSIYNVLAEDKTITIQISGYTDGLGTDVYNRKLSDKRANACASYLAKKGIAPNRITFVSFGECCPVEMELINGRDNPDGRTMNRRALINISKQE